MTEIQLQIEKALEALLDTEGEGYSRFDALLDIRNTAVVMVNAERDAEKKRLVEARDKLKAKLKAQQDRLRSVSVVTKPRGKREKAAQATS